MAERSLFKYVRHDEIDAEKWNDCIDRALNSRIYAYDWHLDRTAVVWDALVWGDYHYVMPLPFRKKMGIKYLYQPLYSQQLGIFPSPPPVVAETFLNYIHANFRYSDMQLNSENLVVETVKGINFVPRQNFLLPLQQDYLKLFNAFSKNTKRNIAKANKQGLTLVEGIRLETYLKFKADNFQAGSGKKALMKLRSIIAFGHRKGLGTIYGVYTPDNNLCAAVYFCRWKDRVIYFNAASSKTGKELGGMYFLLNKFIEQNAGKAIILDLEGSMIPGVARFYSGFGAHPETYFQLKFNRLPLLLKWFKQ